MKLNKACELEDFGDGDAVALIRAMEPELAELYPDYPAGKEHRKSWEYQQVIRGAVQLGALRNDAIVLCFPAGRERTVFEISTRVKYVFACDIYGANDQNGIDPFLVDPGSFAKQPWAPTRLIARHMDAQFLRFDSETMDFVVCPGFSRFSPAPESAGNLLLEFERVLRPGGYGVLCLELAVDGADPCNVGPQVYTAQAIRNVLSVARNLELIEDIQEVVSPATLATKMALAFAKSEGAQGRSKFPHIVLDAEGRQFTSSTVFFRKIF